MKKKECIIIGDPIEQSLSPKLHTTGYKALGIEDKFEFSAQKVSLEELEQFIATAKQKGIHGITCTIPHKITVMQYLDKLDQIAKDIGAVNTIVNENGLLVGYNTDYYGTIIPLKQKTKLKGKKVVLVGAGGASRAMAYGVLTHGAELTIYNRTLTKAEELANDMAKLGYKNCKARSMNDIEYIKECDIIINSTNLGMGENEGGSPIQKELLTKNHIVFDAVYKPRKTQLIQDALSVGAQVIYGSEMLLHQGVKQFEYYTGIKAPLKAMAKIL